MYLYNKNLLCPLFTFMCAFQGLWADDVDLIRDESLIPFYAELNQSVVTEAGALAAGERVVVIRPENRESVRVEVPRKGIVTLPVEVTNLAEEIEHAKNADASNVRQVPRMSFFFANRIISGESGWQDPVHADMIYAYKRWIILYGDANKQTTKSAVIAASKYYESLAPAEQELTLFVYLDVLGEKVAIQELADAIVPKIHSMPGYLSKGYAKSLDQIEAGAELPQLVEVAPSGRILERANGLEAVMVWLNR
jgi:hypothetical protein